MVTATAAQGNWLAEAAEVQKRIEDTNALFEREWKWIREAGAEAAPEEAPRIDGGDWRIEDEGRWLETANWRAEAVAWRLEAVWRRLGIIWQWFTDARAFIEANPGDKGAFVREFGPSLPEIKALAQECREYLDEIEGLLDELKAVRFRWLKRIGPAVFAGAAAAVLGFIAGGYLAGWVLG